MLCKSRSTKVQHEKRQAGNHGDTKEARKDELGNGKAWRGHRVSHLTALRLSAERCTGWRSGTRSFTDDRLAHNLILLCLAAPASSKRLSGSGWVQSGDMGNSSFSGHG